MDANDLEDRRERAAAATLDRRTFLLRGAAGALALPLAGGLLAACGGQEQELEATAPGAEPAPAPTSPPAEAPEPPPQAAAQEPAAGGGSDQLVTEIPQAQGLVSSLQYVNESPEPDKRCSNCQLYTAQDDQRGKCQLFAVGLVAAGGYCTSWIAKS